MTANTASSPAFDSLSFAPRRKVRRIRSPFTLLFCVLVGGLFAILGVFGEWIAPHDPEHLDLIGRLEPPVWYSEGSWEHPLGTDELGRDTLSRLIVGARISLLTVVLTIPLAMTIGSTLGLAAGWYHGWTDRALMGLVDVQLALPAVLFAVMLASIFGPSFSNVVLVLVVALWAGFARLVRAETLTVTAREYVLAAKASGASDARIVLRHVLPNVSNAVIILATLNIASVILAEASLSFLGVGVPQDTISWGLMIASGRNLLGVAPWLVAVPGVAIVVTALVGNVFGDWLRDALDPRLRNLR